MSLSRRQNNIVYLAALLLFSHTQFAFASNQFAIDQYNAATEPLLEQSTSLGDRQTELMEKLQSVADNSKSAVKALNSEYIGQMYQVGEQTLALADQYLLAFEGFQTELSKNSVCYQPESALEFAQTIEQRRQANQALLQIKQSQVGDDEGAAAIALLNVQVHSGQLQMLVHMFEMSKMCFIGEAMGLSQEDIKRMQALESDPNF
ncbi:hypothetical protein [Shewanella maritima]|uniref:hypothetical protein n=1 Tax=Shewanella maritima TaxID=2520507 RepID=UPI003734F63E